jgi:N-acetylglucosaminyl-diphospho-decaprenol L-rhamnosyltransferase
MALSTPGRLGIVIVNWNSGRYLQRCLESLSVCEGLDRVEQVIVIDNDSHDGSWDHLPATSVPLKVVRNQANLGFAAACNQGAALCQTEYLLFLNPDTELLGNSLSVPLDYLDNPLHHQVGICGIQLLNKKGQVARSCSRLPTGYTLMTLALRLQSVSRRLFPPPFMKEWDHGKTQAVEQVIGAFYLVRTELFRELNGFDERFFVYFEEVDFCKRTHQLGLQTVYLATAQARHVGGGCSVHDLTGSHYYLLNSRLAYAEKHFKTWQSTMIKATTLFCEPLIRLMGSVFKLRWSKMGLLLHAHGRLWQTQFAPGKPVRHSLMPEKPQNNSC